MPKLETYTASGNIRGGPVAAGTPAEALTAPYRAVERAGYQIANVGDEVAQLAQQRQKENDLTWATEASAQYSRILAERRAADAQNPRETEGPEFRDFADQQLSDYAKNAPSKRAADIFRSHGLSVANSGYEQALRSGEQTRLINADLSNDKATADIVATYKNIATVDNPVGAAQDISRLVSGQLASIETRFGKTMPALAEKMRNHVVSEVALGTAPTNPDYARQLVESAPIDEKSKLILNNKIDSIERDSLETASFNTVKLFENAIAVGYDKLVPVPTPNPAILKTLPPNQAEKIAFDTKVANTTISEFSKVKAWNWQEQQKSIQAIDITGDPVKEQARENLVKLLAKSKQQQTENPAGWQFANDSEFSTPPTNTTPAAIVSRLNRMVSLQGPAPADATPEQAKRYLNLPTGLQKASSVDQAKERAARYNNTAPNALTKLIADFEAEFPDPKIAAMVWNDMQNLPEESKLKMGLRVGAAVENEAVRNNFLGAMSNKEPLKTEDGRDKFVTELQGRDFYRRFVSGWKGDGGQRGNELSELGEAVTRYAMHLSVDNKLKTGEAVDLAIKRVLSDNYGLMNIHGSDVPVHRFPKGGGFYDDKAISNAELGITDLLSTLSTDSIATDLYHFPLQPRLPGSQKEADTYLRKAIRQTGTVVVEPDGQSATVYIKGDSVDDFPFQVRDKKGEPLRFNFSDVMARGAAMQKEIEIMRSGTLKQQENLIESRRRESMRRLGINPDTGKKY